MDNDETSQINITPNPNPTIQKRKTQESAEQKQQQTNCERTSECEEIPTQKKELNQLAYHFS